MPDFNLEARLILSGADISRAQKDINKLQFPKINLGGGASGAAAGVTELSADINRLAGQMKRLGDDIVGVSRDYGKLKSAQEKANASTKQATSNIEDFADKAGLALRRFTAFSIAAGGVFGSIRLISSSIKDAIAFEREMLRVVQVTDALPGKIKELRKTIGELGTSFGSSAAELVESAKVFSQAGLSLAETQDAIKAVAQSTLAPTFSDAKETTEALIAVQNQFNIKAKDFSKVLSVINAVSAKYAVESDDLVKAVQRAGGAFQASSQGVTTGIDALAQFAAQITAVRSTTREGAESIATGFRTIITRLQRPVTINFLKDFGIQLRDANGQFVGAFAAIQRIGKAIRGLPTTDTRFAQIAEQLGGYRQITKVIPLLQELDKQTEAYNVGLQGINSITEESEQAQGNLAVELNKLREEFSAFIRETVNTESFKLLAKGAIEFSRALIKVADSLKEVLPLIASIQAARFLGSFTFGGGASRFFGRVLTNNNPIQRRASGGLVKGPGTSTSDDVLVRLSKDEFVINADSVRKAGRSNLEYINSTGKIPKTGLPGFADGTPNLTPDPNFFKFLSNNDFKNTIDKLSDNLLSLGYSVEQVNDIVMGSTSGARGPGEAEKFATINIGKIIEKSNRDVVDEIRKNNQANLLREEKEAQKNSPENIERKRRKPLNRVYASDGLPTIPQITSEEAGISTTTQGRIQNRTISREDYKQFKRLQRAGKSLSQGNDLALNAFIPGFFEQTSSTIPTNPIENNIVDLTGASSSNINRRAKLGRSSGRFNQFARSTRKFVGKNSGRISGGLGVAAAIGSGLASQSEDPFISNVGTGAVGGAFIGASLGINPVVAGTIGALNGLNTAFKESANKLREIKFEEIQKNIDSYITKIQQNPNLTKEQRDFEAENFIGQFKNIKAVQEQGKGSLISSISRIEDVKNLNALGFDAGIKDPARFQKAVEAAQREENLISANGTDLERSRLFLGDSDVFRAGASAGDLVKNIFDKQTYSSLFNAGEKLLRGDTSGVKELDTFAGTRKQDAITNQIRADIVNRAVNKQASDRAALAKPGADAAKEEIKRLIFSGRGGAVGESLRVAAAQDDFGVQRGGSRSLANFIGGEFEKSIRKQYAEFQKLAQSTANYQANLDALNESAARTKDILGLFGQELQARSASTANIGQLALGNVSNPTGTRINPFENIQALSQKDIGSAISNLEQSTGTRFSADVRGLVGANAAFSQLGPTLREAVKTSRGLEPGSSDALEEAISNQLSGGGLLGGLSDNLKGKIREGLSAGAVTEQDAERFKDTGELPEFISKLIPPVENVTAAMTQLQEASNQFADTMFELGNQRTAILERGDGLFQDLRQSKVSQSEFRNDVLFSGTRSGEAIDNRKEVIGSFTGGTVDPSEVGDNIRFFKQQRNNLLATGRSDPEAQKLLSQFNAGIISNTKALQTLGSEVIGLAAIQKELAEVESRRRGTQDSILSAAFSSPEERKQRAKGAFALQALQGASSANDLLSQGISPELIQQGIQDRIQSLQQTGTPEQLEKFRTEITQKTAGLFGLDKDPATAAFIKNIGAVDPKNTVGRGKELADQADEAFARQQEAIAEQARLLTEGLTEFDASLNATFASGLDRLSEAAQQLSTLQNMTLTVTHSDINVNLNGAELLASLDPYIKERSLEIVNQAISNLTNGQGPVQVEQKRIPKPLRR